MHAHATYARVTRVGMIKPVVMIGHIVRQRILFHAAHSGFAGVPEMVIRNRHILRVSFHINSSVAFFLVACRTGAAIETVNMMHPHMAVFGI